MSDLSVKDRARIELAVHRIDYSLEWRVSRAKRRQIREELRANLTDAAQQVGAEEAVRRLGDLRALAKSYIGVYRGRWDFRAGWWAMVITYALIQVLSLAVSFAFSAGVVAGGGHAASYALWSGFGPFAGSASANGYEVTLGSPAHLALMALAFVVGSAHRQILRR
ncbi:MAG: hypothetical protein ACREOM_08000 [Candidatus Dormibacteraceae bacterium]